MSLQSSFFTLWSRKSDSNLISSISESFPVRPCTLVLFCRTEATVMASSTTFSIKAAPGTDIWRKPPSTDVFNGPSNLSHWFLRILLYPYATHANYSSWAFLYITANTPQHQPPYLPKTRPPHPPSAPKAPSPPSSPLVSPSSAPGSTNTTKAVFSWASVEPTFPLPQPST
jgi:hypothetical protein